MPSSAESSTVAARRTDRQRADAIRKRLGEQRERAARAPLASAPPTAALDPASEQKAAQRRRDFIRRAVQEQYIPVARSCYEELLARLPRAQGKIVIYFTIVGDDESGGVVDHVELRDGTTFDDPEFVLCMRESMYATLFDPPPPGASATTVEYPLELSP